MSDQASILAALRTSAEELQRELERLPEAAADWRPAEAEWSQRECLKHLQLVERHIFLARLQAMVSQENPFLPVVDEAALMAHSQDLPRAELLADFLAARQAEISLLEQHPWTRPGQHAVRGPINLGWIAHYAVGHTWEHLSQAMRVRLNYECPAVRS